MSGMRRSTTSGRVRRAAVTGVVGMTATCLVTAAAPASATPTAPARVASVAPVTAGETPSPLTESEVERILGERRDDVAISVHDRRSGSVFTYNADLENSTGSIVKVMVLVALIERRRDSGRDLSDRQKALADAMIRFSDNDATTTLLSQAGGSRAVTDLAEDLRMRSTQGRGTWGRTSTTVIDQRMLMDALVDGKILSPADRRYVLGLMRRVTPEQRWGVGSVPSGTTAEVKNGWVELSPRGWRVNSIGHVHGNGRDYTIAMLSYDNPSQEAGVTKLDALSEYVYSTLGPASGGAAAASAPSGDPAGPVLGEGLPTWLRSRGSAYPPRLWW